MNVIKSIFAVVGVAIASSSMAALEDTTGRDFVAELPDAIVCILNNPQKTKYIYYKTGGAYDDVVRYDGLNNFMLHYDLPSGTLMMNFNPQPASADCVSQQFSLQYLIDNKRAYKILTPMSSGSGALQ